MLKTPEPFSLTLEGPTGHYVMSYETNRDGGQFRVSGGSLEAVWAVEQIEEIADGWEMAGMTSGTNAAWGDVFWFVVQQTQASRVQYWGDQVLLRTDQATVASPAISGL